MYQLEVSWYNSQPSTTPDDCLNTLSSMDRGFTNTSGSGSNVTGADLTDSLNVLGTFEGTVALDAPLGTIISVPAPTNVSLLNASGQQTIEPVSYLYVGTVVAAPEPSTWALMLCGIALLCFRTNTSRFRVATGINSKSFLLTSILRLKPSSEVKEGGGRELCQETSR